MMRKPGNWARKDEEEEEKYEEDMRRGALVRFFPSMPDVNGLTSNPFAIHGGKGHGFMQRLLTPPSHYIV